MTFNESVQRFKAVMEEVAKKALTDDAMKKMIPMFVESTKIDDHKCGNCSMRVVGPDGKARCTIVEGVVSLKKGVCTFWAEGIAASEKDIHDAQMSQKLAGYVETKSDDQKIQCGTCRFFADGYCKLWMGTVKPEQCCMAYDSRIVT